jgi:hypothetical protein
VPNLWRNSSVHSFVSSLFDAPSLAGLEGVVLPRLRIRAPERPVIAFPDHPVQVGVVR